MIIRIQMRLPLSHTLILLVAQRAIKRLQRLADFLFDLLLTLDFGLQQERKRKEKKENYD